MSWLDLIIIVMLAGYVFGGFKAGLIQSVGGIIGLLIGFFAASRWYLAWAPNFTGVVGGNELWAKVVAFIIIFFIATRVVAIIIWFVNKLFNLVAIVPGLKFMNRVTGAIFGFLEGALFIGLTIQFVNRLPIPQSWADSLHGSFMVPILLGITGWLVPFLPKALKESQKALDTFFPKNINVDVNGTMKTINAVKDSGVLNSNLPI
jgi:membrane protein required for colicin V production